MAQEPAIDFEALEKAAGLDKISDEQLRSISSLAEQQVALEQRIEKANTATTELSRELNKINSEQLPEAMATVGMDNFTSTDGRSITIKKGIDARITDLNKAKAHQWLHANGNGSIIKNTFTVLLGLDDAERAKKLALLLTENGFDFSQKEAVPVPTLKKFVKDELDRDKNSIPEESGIKYYEYRISKIK